MPSLFHHPHKDTPHASNYSLLVRVSGPVGVFNRFRHSHHPGWLFLLGLDQQAHQVTHDVTVLVIEEQRGRIAQVAHSASPADTMNVLFYVTG